MGIFERIKLQTPLDTEELRHDIPPTKPAQVEYRALAPNDSSTAEPVWNILKITYDGSGNKEREQLFQAQIWDDRRNL